jgi:hypothetical protein
MYPTLDGYGVMTPFSCALGFLIFTSRILATGLWLYHCHFKSLMEYYFHSFTRFLPLFCNCQFRRLGSVQFPAHILAHLHPETRLFTLDYCSILLLLGRMSKSKSKLYYDRRTVGHSVLEQSTHFGLTTSNLKSCFSRVSASGYCCLVASSVFFYNPSARTTQKTQPLLLRRHVYWSAT